MLINSTKNSEEMNKLRKWLNEMKNENNSLKEENNVLKMENKKAFELIIQEKSGKVIRNIDNKLKNNDYMENREKFISKHKGNNSIICSENEENKEKTKKFRFIKPKN